MENSATSKPRRRFNWWKAGFFFMVFMLFVLECWREITILELDQEAAPGIQYMFAHRDTYTEAAGFWKRTDKKEAMDGVPVSIQCNQKRGTCILVYLHGLGASKPDVLDLPAQFTKDSITFVDHQEDCVEGPIQIDLQQKVVRHWHEPTCKRGASGKGRISYILSDDRDPGFPKKYPEDEHFLPLLSILKMFI